MGIVIKKPSSEEIVHDFREVAFAFALSVDPTLWGNDIVSLTTYLLPEELIALSMSLNSIMDDYDRMVLIGDVHLFLLFVRRDGKEIKYSTLIRGRTCEPTQHLTRMSVYDYAALRGILKEEAEILSGDIP